ncbi:hypothetical protein HK28_12625 [Acetobacter sp. DsW_063]|nr:hypothetical protein HK28_12625 [Acetobacter sp. DsW_063]
MQNQKLQACADGKFSANHNDGKGPWITQDGRPARVICTDARAGLPVVALALNEVASREEIFCYRADGRFYSSRAESHLDLLNAEYVPVRREFWANVYPHGGLFIAATKAVADREASSSRIECIHVREVLPGDES